MTVEVADGVVVPLPTDEAKIVKVAGTITFTTRELVAVFPEESETL